MHHPSLRFLAAVVPLALAAAPFGCQPFMEHQAAESRAVADLGCTSDAVTLTSTPGNGYVAHGCGRTERVTCFTNTSNVLGFHNTEVSCVSSDVTQDAPDVDATPVAAAPTSSSPPPPPKDDPTRALAKIALQSIPYADCGAPGAGKIVVTFANDGTTSFVEVSDGSFDEKTASCVVSRFQSAHVEPFEGKPRTFAWRVAIAEKAGS